MSGIAFSSTHSGVWFIVQHNAFSFLKAKFWAIFGEWHIFTSILYSFTGRSQQMNEEFTRSGRWQKSNAQLHICKVSESAVNDSFRKEKILLGKEPKQWEYIATQTRK